MCNEHILTHGKIPAGSLALNGVPHASASYYIDTPTVTVETTRPPEWELAR